MQMLTVERATRRMILDRLTALPAGRLISLAAIGAAGPGFTRVRAQDATPAPFADVAEVVNYALALEHIEAVFYRVGMKKFKAADFEALGFQGGVRESVAAIAGHEKTHVELLTSTVSDLGGEPVAEGDYDFPYRTLAEFLAIAAVLESVGVAAYTGAAQFLQGEPDLLGTALSIHSVAARHAAYLNLLSGGKPFPTAFEVPQTRDQIEAAVGVYVAE
jgi:hypothetical protein